jgi:endonuclease YncB( thermonuclease family)
VTIAQLRPKKPHSRIARGVLLFAIVAATTFVVALSIVYWIDTPTTIAITASPPTQIKGPGSIQVVDGDTIRAKGLTYRLVGFDTPETVDAKCPQERALGIRAAARLRAIVAQGSLNLVEVTCSCMPGTHGTRFCNHGRRCGTLKAKGEDVGRILIREGLARPYVCSSYQCPKRQPWC